MARVPESFWHETDKKKTDWFPRIMIGLIFCSAAAALIFALCMR